MALVISDAKDVWIHIIDIICNIYHINPDEIANYHEGLQAFYVVRPNLYDASRRFDKSIRQLRRIISK